MCIFHSRVALQSSMYLRTVSCARAITNTQGFLSPELGSPSVLGKSGVVAASSAALPAHDIERFVRIICAFLHAHGNKLSM